MIAYASGPTVVLDTSVVVKWLRQEEELADEALAWRARFYEGQLQIAVPSLLAYELANVMTYKADQTSEQVLEALTTLFQMGLHWFPPSPGLIDRAFILARHYRITVYDASFVALAEALGADMITADVHSARRLAGLAFVHVLGE